MTTQATQLRAMLFEALRGCDEAFIAGLGPLATWDALSALWAAGWLGSGRASLRSTAAEIRQHLREISSSVRRADALAPLPRGTLVCVSGVVRDAALEALVLDDDSGAEVLVRADTAALVGGTPQVGGTALAVGLVDHILDPAAAAAPRRLPTRPVVSAGDARRVVVVVTRAAD